MSHHIIIVDIDVDEQQFDYPEKALEFIMNDIQSNLEYGYKPASLYVYAGGTPEDNGIAPLSPDGRYQS